MMRTRSRHSTTIGSAALAAAAALMLGGCSDDVVCPDGSAGLKPYVLASVVETRGSWGARTVGTAFCTADTLPAYLIVSVNDREFPPVGSGGAHGLSAALEEDILLWPPGTLCSLEVATDFGLADATAAVPGACEVAAPDSVAVGEDLVLSWTAADSADYYEVRAALRAASPGDSVLLFVATEDTTVTFGAADITMAGTVVGRVFAVAGPFPDGGNGGNVTGAAWGFFTVAFSDTTGEFVLRVTDAPRSP